MTKTVPQTQYQPQTTTVTTTQVQTSYVPQSYTESVPVTTYSQIVEDHGCYQTQRIPCRVRSVPVRRFALRWRSQALRWRP